MDSPLTTSSADARIVLLGPVSMTIAEQKVGLGSRLQRGLLAALAARAGEVVPMALIVEGLWGDQPPPTAGATLRAYVSRARAAVGRDRLVSEDGGFRLDLDPGHVDALAVEGAMPEIRSLADTDLTAAGVAARQQLARWRGDALADLRGLPFADTAAARWHQLRAELRVTAWRASLADGNHAAVLDDLRRSAEAHLEDERVIALHMVALLRDGQHAAALRTFDDLRVRLAETLGADPSNGLRRMHHRVLEHDPGLLRGDPLAAEADRLTPVPAGAPAAAGAVGPAAPSTAWGSSNLPTPLTSFIGRTAQLEMAERLLHTGRLLTITGMGGVGKTRMALEAARRQRPRSTDGPWLVELAGVADPADVGCATAQALGIGCPGEEPLAAMSAALTDRHTTLVVDNCEHVLDAVADMVAGLLAACPGLRVLATSREPLGVPGEQVMLLRPLPATAPDDPAITLFIERARLVDPDFAPTGATAEAVSRVCTALDGLPLAVELAAARLSVWAPEQMADMLDNRFAMLEGRRASGAPHHRTMASAIGWSYDPLPEGEKALLHAASSFAGGFTVATLADAMSGGVDPDLGATAAGIGRLVDKSLVAVHDGPEGRRYVVLETIREYCRERVGPEGWAALADQHLAWALRVGERIAGAYLGKDRPWTVAVEERDNFRAALVRCQASGNVAAAVHLCGDLSWSWFRLGQVTDGNRWLDGFLPEADDADLPPEDLAQAWMGRSLGAYLAGDLPTATRAVGRAAAAAERADDEVLMALTSVYLAYYEGAFGNVEVADGLVERAERHDLPGWVHAEIDMVRGQVRRAQGRTADALSNLARAREIAAEWQHSYVWASAGWIQAKVLVEARRHAEAGEVLAGVLRQLAIDGDRSSTVAGLHTMAAIAAGRGRPYEGAVLLGAVDRLGQRMGFHPARMDPIDGPVHRATVESVLPRDAVERAVGEGAAMTLREAIALAVSIGNSPSRTVSRA